jgi:uncharacterized protein YhfF
MLSSRSSYSSLANVKRNYGNSSSTRPLRGAKTATASLRREYEPFTGEPMPKVGEQLVLLGNEDEPVSVVETTEVLTVPAGRIDLKFARDEGEGFETMADWWAAHVRFWVDERITDDTVVVSERFRVVQKF